MVYLKNNNNKISISVVVATYNIPEDTLELVRSIDMSLKKFKKEYKYKKLLFEVIISDNSTNRLTKDIFDKNTFSYLKYFKTPPLGCAYARDYAIKKSKYEYIAIIDADCIVHQDYVKQIYLSIKRGASVIQGAYSPSYNDDWISKSEYKWNIRRWEEGQADTRNFIIKKKIYLKIGGFDIKHFYAAGAEDLVLVDRIKDIGLKMVFNKKLIVYHKYPPFWGEMKRYSCYGKACVHIKKYYPNKFKDFSPITLWKWFFLRIGHESLKELGYQFMKLLYFTRGYFIGKKHYSLEEKEDGIINPIEILKNRYNKSLKK